ncbi:hypothetical protein D7X33_17610 [Butyricicoccus sp. 1XD8-22]|nr:hypothetical protein D7X33_17610 [Butyricicoccus sp. 1XD8-22]
MNLQKITIGGGCIVALMSLVQVAPFKINPWSAIGKAFTAIGRALGKALNGAVIEKLDKLEAMQTKTRQLLDEHILVDDERNADLHRTCILHFNMELLMGILHTDKDFNEILYNIDCYERYCKEHPEYQNNRAVHTIKHIKNVRDKRIEQNNPE